MARITPDEVADAIGEVARINREDDELYDALQTVLGDRDACGDLAILLSGGDL